MHARRAENHMFRPVCERTPPRAQANSRVARRLPPPSHSAPFPGPSLSPDLCRPFYVFDAGVIAAAFVVYSIPPWHLGLCLNVLTVERGGWPGPAGIQA